MKKVIAIIILFFVGVMAVKCSKPRLTKEQQNNITTQIARNYDVKEIEFLYFGHDWVVGFYSVKIKINGDENKIHVMRYHDPKEFDDDTLDIGLSPIDSYKDIERKERITGKIDLSTIKIKYLE